MSFCAWSQFESISLKPTDKEMEKDQIALDYASTINIELLNNSIIHIGSFSNGAILEKANSLDAGT